SVDRVVLVSGKLYWELLADRTKREDTRTALVRVEQLYPLDDEAIAEVLGQYPADADPVRPQAAPDNQGAALLMAPPLPATAGRELRVVSRAASASTATGLKKVHDAEQADVVERVFAR